MFNFTIFFYEVLYSLVFQQEQPLGSASPGRCSNSRNINRIDIVVVDMVVVVVVVVDTHQRRRGVVVDTHQRRRGEIVDTHHVASHAQSHYFLI
jgi:hypothetical protein